MKEEVAEGNRRQKLKKEFKMVQPKRNFFKIELRRFCWVLLFGLVAFLAYYGAVRGRNSQICEYKNKLIHLQAEKKKITLENQDLQLKINSQSDPAWIELILMKELGVVPEGKLKVHFTHQK